MAKPISTTIRVKDEASAPLRTISKNLGKCISAFMRLHTVSSTAISVSTFSTCESLLENIDKNVEKIRKNMESTTTSSTSFGHSMSYADSNANNLLSTLKRVAATYFTLQGAGNVIDTSDMLAQAKQRLSLTLREGENVDEINKKIMASANSARASYTDTLNQVSKLAMNAGKSFESTDQITKFVEQFNKLATMSGASVYESSQAMYQLTQSMAKGKLDGDELRSVLEGMPLVAQEIAKYMSTDLELLEKLGKTEIDVGTMKQLAADGMVTAEVVKNALLGSATETDEMFKQMPQTWSQIWQSFKNNAIQAFTPVLERINEIANNPQVQEFVNGLVGGMYAIANVTMFVFDIIGGLFGLIYDNWSILQPILVAGLTILGLYTAALLVNMGVQAAKKVISAISTVIEYAHAKAILSSAAAYSASTVATATATVAQASFNTALFACPLTWIILLIIALITVLYIVCGRIAKTSEVATTAFGVMAGGINVVIQFFKNLFFTALNVVFGIVSAIDACATNISVAFSNAISGVKSWFYDLLSTALTVVDGICAALNKLPFVEFDYSGITTKANEYARKSADAAASKGDYVNVGDAFNSGFNTFDTFQDGWVKDAYKSGAAWGDGVANKVGDMFNMEDLSKYEIGDFEVPAFEEMNNSLGDIKDNTGKTAKSVDISQEDLKYLRDIAEQEAINRFTTAEIKVEMKNNNNINNNMDLDGVVDHLATRITETMGAVAAGAY